MAIQHRRGSYSNFDKTKLLPAEIAVVQSGDPSSSDGDAIYIGTATGQVKQLATKEDLESDIQNAMYAAIDDTLSEQGKAADAKAVGDAIAAIEPGLSDDAKAALLACFAHVAWVDEHGQDYYDALEAALNESEYPRITATFTPGSHIVYTDDELSTLIPYLVVKYYEDESDEGTTVSSNDYTLSGTLAEGQSVIRVSYDDLATTFALTAIDYYNIHVWDFATHSTELYMVRDVSAATSIDRGEGQTYRYVPEWNIESGETTRSTFQTTKGKADAVLYVHDDATPTSPPKYLIPIPQDAVKVTGSITPSNQYFSIREWKHEYGNNWTRGYETGWKQGTATYTFTLSQGEKYISINCKPASNGRTPYDSTNYPRPTNFHIEFLTE